MENNKVYDYADKFLMKPEMYFEILMNLDINKCCEHPPILPKPSEMYIFLNPQKKYDWKSDQYQWEDRGRKEMPKQAPVVIGRYYRARDGSQFFKRAYSIHCDQIADITDHVKNATLIHYVGDNSKTKLLPHGNRKAQTADIPHIRTAPSVISEQKEVLNAPPQKIYKKQLESHVPPPLAPVLLPRDRKQVSNTISVERDRRLLSKDDLIGLYLLHKELPTFVQEIVLVKNFYAILCNEDMLKHFNEISSRQDILLTYDTTFNMGDFYVSPLTFKHTLFESGPVIPVAYLIHDKKPVEVHQSFFHFVKRICPSIDGLDIVTDREAAINQAIERELTNSHNFFCWNHILRDVRYWLERNHKGSTVDDRNIYTQHIRDLLDSDSLNIFEEKLKFMYSQWSSQFAIYFDKHLQKAIIASGKWVLETHKKYCPSSGITTNAAEGFNSVLKRCIENKEVNLQVLTLTLYQLNLYYEREIVRGFCNMGNYKLKKEFSHLKKNASDVTYSQELVPLDKLPYIFYNKDFKIVDHDHDERPFTNFSVAKAIILNGGVKLVPEERTFIVTSLDRKHQYLVHLFPHEICTCKLQKRCHHITAAKMSIGCDDQKLNYSKLSKLMRKERGHKSGRKKVPKNITIVECAEDSLGKGDENLQMSLMIPTATSASGIVRQRFCAPFIKGGDESFPRPSPFPANLAASTPLVSKKSTLDGTETLRRNQQFFIGNCQVYYDELKCFNPKSQKAEDYFLTDTIIDAYLVILQDMYRKRAGSVTVSVVEGYLLHTAVTQFDQYFASTFRHVIKYKIPEQDVVLWPLTIGQHHTLVVVLRKLKYIIYLDSLGSSFGDKERKVIRVIFLLYAEYYQMKTWTFDEKLWTVFVPHDIPLQKNAYDCGMYCCLFSEIILNQQLNEYIKDHDMRRYRHYVSEILQEYMVKELIPRSKGENMKTTIANSKVPLYEDVSLYSLKEKVSVAGDTIGFLAKIVNNYWDEDTAGTCHLDKDCNNIGQRMVLCNECDHWYHVECLQTATPQINGELFICPRH